MIPKLSVKIKLPEENFYLILRLLLSYMAKLSDYTVLQNAVLYDFLHKHFKVKPVSNKIKTYTLSLTEASFLFNFLNNSEIPQSLEYIANDLVLQIHQQLISLRTFNGFINSLNYGTEENTTQPKELK